MGISQIDEFVELLDNGKGNPAEIHRGPRFVLALPFVLHKCPIAFFALDTRSQSIPVRSEGLIVSLQSGQV
ncbi:MAG: hypothetical protein JWO91_3036 [Acidobacteriaceae bacterium]|nr:hypothetical protein [Acidobacteriaceae bacterium]